MSSATSGLVDRTASCIVTSLDSTNLARSNTSKPPRNVPGTNRNFCIENLLVMMMMS